MQEEHHLLPETFQVHIMAKLCPKTWLVTNTPEIKSQTLLFFFEKAFTDGIRNFIREWSERFKPNNYTLLCDSSWKIREYFPVPVSAGHQPLCSQMSGAAGLAQLESQFGVISVLLQHQHGCHKKITVIGKKQLFSQIKMNPRFMARGRVRGRLAVDVGAVPSWRHGCTSSISAPEAQHRGAAEL